MFQAHACGHAEGPLSIPSIFLARRANETLSEKVQLIACTFFFMPLAATAADYARSRISYHILQTTVRDSIHFRTLFNFVLNNSD
jgi:hypothetical protein